MRRDVDRLTGRSFDVLVVGGGIYGLTVAYDAAQRGLSVALVERDDFGSGATFNHLRTIHGGLRYLQSLDIRRARESVGERRTLARIAPHAVRPLAFALPLYRSLTRGRLAMRAGFFLDRCVAFDRNRDVPATHVLPAGRVISRDAAIQRFPGLRRHGMTGAAVWYDYVTTEADRLTFSWAEAAARHDAVLANHIEATAPLTESGRVAGIHAVDRSSGRELSIQARLTVNATAGQADALFDPGRGAPRVPLLKAMNLVTSRDAGEEALGGRSASGRNLFLVPWRGKALFGTWESSSPVAVGDRRVDEAEVASFITELNQAFPSLDLTRADVTMIHRGLVPAVHHPDGRVSLQGDEQIRHDVDGLIDLAGTKYTTARRVAARVTDLIFQKLQRPPVACRTAMSPLPGGSLRDVSWAIAEARREHDAALPSDTIPHLVEAYGSRYSEVLKAAEGRPDLLRRVGTGSPVIGAEIVWAVREEMAVTLSDAVIRRTPLGALGFPGDEAVRRAAVLAGAELGWSDEQTRAEIDAVRRYYA